MTNFKQSNLIRDFEFVRRVIANPENTINHFKSLQRLVDLFESNHGWTTEYTLHLHSMLINLENLHDDEKFKS